MKKTILFSLIILISSICISCASYPLVKGNRDYTLSEKSVSPFEKINGSGAADIRFNSGREYRVVVTADSNLINYVRADVKDNTLFIGTDSGSFLFSKFVVDVYCPVLTGISLSGSGSFTGIDKITASTFEAKLKGSGKISGTIECETFNANISGSGKLDGSVKCEAFNANVSGSGRINISGSGKDASIKNSGSGRLIGDEFVINNANIHIGGSSVVNINVIDNLNVNISNSGKLNYHGNPKIDSDISGSARITKL